MWQFRWQIYSPKKSDFTFLLLVSYSESSHVADFPPQKWQFGFLLKDSYSESSHVSDQVTDLSLQK